MSTITKRKVTEVDFRKPEYAIALIEDYEFRDDGVLVRKDRWEQGMRSIANIFGCSRSFEIDDLVSQVKALHDDRKLHFVRAK